MKPPEDTKSQHKNVINPNRNYEMIYHNSTSSSALSWDESVLQIASSCCIPCEPVKPNEMHTFKCVENKDLRNKTITGGFQKPEPVPAEICLRYT